MEEALIRQFGFSFIDISSYLGLIAGGILTLNLFTGMLLSIQYSPITKWPYCRIPLFNIHKWSGYGAYFFSLLHPLWLVLAKEGNFSVLAIFYPVVAPIQPFINTIGALSIYTLTFVIITAYLRNLFHYPFWKKLHYASYLAIILFLIHGVFANPSLKANQPINFFDGGKLFVEACVIISISLIVLRITLGEKLRKNAIEHNAHLHRKKASWHGVLKVINIFNSDNPSVKTFRLAMPQDGELPFNFLPGQYLSFRIKTGTRLLTRSYSISSAPYQKNFCDITVKKSENGLGSDFLHSQVKIGSLLECIGPEGTFTFTGCESNDLVMIAGGIGITPLISILKSLAIKKWPHNIYLLFAISTPADILFQNELQEIKSQYSFLKLLILPSKITGFAWEGPHGRINSKHLTDFVPHINHHRVHLCGPEAMMTATITILKSLGVSDTQIYTEAFGRSGNILDDSLVDATILFKKSKTSCFVQAGKTLLEAAEEAGILIDSSCQTGFCGTCKVQLLTGQTKMHSDEALSRSELKNNIVLACQARPVTSNVEIDA